MMLNIVLSFIQWLRERDPHRLFLSIPLFMLSIFGLDIHNKNLLIRFWTKLFFLLSKIFLSPCIIIILSCKLYNRVFIFLLRSRINPRSCFQDIAVEC